MCACVCVSLCVCGGLGWGAQWLGLARGARLGTHMRLVLQKMRTREPGGNVLICWMRLWSFSCALDRVRVRVGVGVGVRVGVRVRVS